MKNRFLKNRILSPEQSRIRQLVLIVSLIGFIATTILTISSVIEQNSTEAIINGSSAILLALSLGTAWFGSIWFGRVALPLTALISISYLTAVGDGIHDPGILAFAIVIAIAILLLRGRGLIIYGTLSVVVILGIIYGGSVGIFEHSPVVASDIIAVLMAMIVSTSILFLNARQLDRSLNDIRSSEQTQIQINQELLETKGSLERQTQELVRANELSMQRVERLRLVAEVANSAASIQELERLLTTVTNLISQRFNIYHTGIFLLDDRREYAVLRAANSEGGQKMLSRGHRLQIGAQGIVGTVTATGSPHIALDVEMDSAFFDNPDLPDTRSEMALPLRFLEDTFGALDLQSIEPNAFTQEDIDVLSILADQVAIAIQNARSLESAQRAAHDVEVAYQQITSQAWSQFAKDQQMRGYQFDGVETRSITNWSSEKDGSTLLIPVRLRGKEIGQIKMRAHQTDRTWTQDEIMMTQAAAERAALALENARLLEDAQNRASQERIIGDISAKLSSSAELEKIMQIAVKELKQALGASEVSLKIGSNEKEY